MSLFDVFAKWLLDKADEKYFKKKEPPSIEKRVQALYELFQSLKDLCSTFPSSIEHYAQASHSELLGFNIKDDIKVLDGIRNNFRPFIPEVEEHLRELRLLMVREGIGDLVDPLSWHIRSTGAFFGIAKLRLSDMESCLDADDYEKFADAQRDLAEMISKIKGSTTAIDLAQKALVELSKKLER